MTKADLGASAIDWSLTTWEGARREQMRRWSELPLEQIIGAIEEMQDIADWLARPVPPPSEGAAR